MRLRITSESAQAANLNSSRVVASEIQKRRNTFSTRSEKIALPLHSSIGGKPISKSGCPSVLKATWRHKLTQLSFWSGLFASSVSKLDPSNCVTQINLRGTHNHSKDPHTLGKLTVSNALAKPRGYVAQQFESAHKTRVIQSASGERYYVKSLQSDLNASNTRRSLPLLNMRRNMAIMDALEIKYPKAEVNVQDDQIELYVQQMPNFKTFHQMTQEGTAADKILTPENRAKYVAAIMLMDDLQDQNVGLQNGKDLAIIDFDCAYNTYYDNLFEPFNNLYYIFGEYYLNTKPTRQDLKNAYALLENLLKNSDQLEQRFHEIYPLNSQQEKVNPFDDFVESTLEKMQCIQSLYELSPEDVIDVPTMGCLSLRIREEIKQKRGTDSVFYRQNDEYLTIQLKEQVTDKGTTGVPKACPKPAAEEKIDIQIPEGAVWALKDIFKPGDPSSFKSVEYAGQGSTPMEVKISRVSDLQMQMVENAYSFKAHVSKDKTIEVFVNPAIGDQKTAHALVQHYARIIGQFPQFIQNGVEKIYIQDEGGDAYSANGYENSILIYKKPFDALFEGDTQHNIEEALFYLCAQAALDVNSKTFPEYEKAIAKDGQALTRYAAQSSSTRVDLIESLPFIYASLKKPDRLTPEMKSLIEKVPHRKEYFQKNIFKLTDLRGAKL